MGGVEREVFYLLLSALSVVYVRCFESHRLSITNYIHCRASGFEFYFNTVHYDNSGNCEAKIPSSELVLERANPYRDSMPVILSGDFNSAESEERSGSCQEAYLMLLDDGYANTHDVAESVVLEMTPGFPPPDDVKEHGMRIDHILYAANTTLFPNVKVTQWIENREVFGEYNNRASDHWAMVADMEF